MALEKFSSQADPTLLHAVKDLAKTEGKPFQTLVHEALTDLLDKRQRIKPRPMVLEAFEQSLKQYDSVYKKLAQ